MLAFLHPIRNDADDSNDMMVTEEEEPLVVGVDWYQSFFD